MTAAPKPKKSEYTKLMKALDKAVFEYLKVRDGSYCHLRGHACKCGGPLQPNHLISRSVKRLRWEPDNIVVGCAGHNTWAHYHQVEWNEVWRAVWPERAKSLDWMRKFTMKYDAGILRVLIAQFEREMHQINRDRFYRGKK